jgi:hypothetical protein
MDILNLNIIETRKKTSFYRELANDDFVARSILLDPLKSLLLIRTDITQEYINEFSGDESTITVRALEEFLKKEILMDIEVYDDFLRATTKDVTIDTLRETKRNTEILEREIIHFSSLEAPGYKKLSLSGSEYNEELERVIKTGNVKELRDSIIEKAEELNEKQKEYFQEEEEDIMGELTSIISVTDEFIGGSQNGRV